MSRHVSNDLKARAKKLAAAQNIPYSAALALIRTPRAPAPAPAAAPTTWVVPQFLYIDLPMPELGDATPCPDCEGRGLSGDTFTLGAEDGSDTLPLVVEVTCSTCLGCGRAEHDQENGCGFLHAEGDEELLDEWADEHLEDEDEEPCHSCHGHRFYYLPGITKGDDGEPEQVLYLRHPCGCTQDTARIITGDLVEVSG